MQNLSGQLITVFGGGGFLGRYVVQRLLARGARVRIAQRVGALRDRDPAEILTGRAAVLHVVPGDQGEAGIGAQSDGAGHLRGPELRLLQASGA